MRHEVSRVDAKPGVRAIVLHPARKTSKPEARTAEDRLSEAVRLADAIELVVADAGICRLPSIRPATLFGSGKVEELGALVAEKDAELAVVDCSLTPVQQRNLERAWRCKVIDRTGLILEIFGARARTREGRLQVELAALSYQRSRLVRSWTHLERQRGGFGFLGGPGESQLEADRRQIDERITKIRHELEAVARTRKLHRKARRRVPYPVVALVGYTNAGKSTLFNRLTGSKVFTDGRLFTTLDPTMRGVTLASGRRVILSDTVGFVSDLPTELIAAFRATLEEVVEADFVVHVRDVAHPDSEAQREDVHQVLCELGMRGTAEDGLIEALNKIDLLGTDERRRIFNGCRRRANVVPVSAITGEGCDALHDLLDTQLAGRQRVVDLSVRLEDGATLAWLYGRGEVLSRVHADGCARLKIRLDPADLARFQRRNGPRPT